jgi:hypothetical protein
MKRFVQLILSLSVLMLAISCGPNWEARGDAAYNTSRGLSGDVKLLKEKEAYINYKNAIDQKGSRASKKLRERFVEMCLKRATRILVEGSYNYDAVHLLITDLDKTVSTDISPALQDGYADLLTLQADSVVIRDRILDALQKMDKAIAVAVTKDKYVQAKKALLGKFIGDNFTEAKTEYADAIKDPKAKDPQMLIRAEYHVLLSLFMDSTNTDAQKLLSDIRKETVGTFSAYLSFINEIPDTAMFRKVNRWDILLAVPTVTKSGGGVTLKTHMYNYSCNPQRLYAKNFFVETVDGTKIPASESSKIEPEILDQEKKTEDLVLNFSGVKGDIKKLIYDVNNGEYHSEKPFF